MSFEKPDKVKNAQLRGDKKLLKAMGRKGGKMAAESLAIKRDRRELAEQEQQIDLMYRELLHKYGEEEANKIFKENS